MVFGNNNWMLNWGHICIEYDNPNFFDHAPMLLNIKISKWAPKVPFRFFNVWADHGDFEKIVKSV